LLYPVLVTTLEGLRNSANIMANKTKNTLRQMNVTDVIEFLKNVSPFQDLDEASIRDLAEGVSMEFYPKGSSILHQDGPASEYLRIVRKGSVKVFIKSGRDDELSIDTRGEGDTFGFLSLVSGDKSRANVVAVEDTTCYLIGKDAVVRLMETYPAFAEYFLVSYLNKYIDKTYKEIHKRSLLYGGGDRLLFTTPVGELITREVVTASQDISIRDAAEIMSENKISSLVIMDNAGIPVGVVTDRDLRDKVVSRGRSVLDPVKSIMSVSLIKAEAKDYCFEAILNMIRYNIHHLLVIDNGRLRGVITNHDLMMLQGTSPISIAREIETQQSIEGLVPASTKINKVVELLMKEGAKASNITRIITEINDRLLRKILEITEKKLGAPPLNYCWISFGSEGRKEQTFKTDQDNAILYEDPETPEKEAEAKRYFSAFTLLVRDSLLKCGFPPCPADYMASNPQWCQPLKVWKKYFSRWISSPTPEALLKSLIFFDFRPLYGEMRLSEDLRSYLAGSLKGQNIFLAQMAAVITKNRPPLGFFRTFIVEKSGAHKDELDLKINGIAPIVDLARFFALETGIPETSTLERIEVLKNRHPVVKELAEDLTQAFEFITLLRIQHQMDQVKKSLPVDNFINPNILSNLEKKYLKESFHIIAKIQDIITEDYKPGMVSG
jgi:CBS domain-containing protein